MLIERKECLKNKATIDSVKLTGHRSAHGPVSHISDTAWSPRQFLMNNNSPVISRKTRHAKNRAGLATAAGPSQPRRVQGVVMDAAPRSIVHNWSRFAALVLRRFSALFSTILYMALQITRLSAAQIDTHIYTYGYHHNAGETCDPQMFNLFGNQAQWVYSHLQKSQPTR